MGDNRQSDGLLLQGQGAKEGTVTMGWSILPDDVEDSILGSLSLEELGRISRTCHSFHRVFHSLLAGQQKALCDLAVAWFGRGRISGLADIIDDFLKGEGVGGQTKLAQNYGYHFHMSPEGLLQLLPGHFRHIPTEQTLEAGAIDLSLSSGGTDRTPSILRVFVFAPNQTWVGVDVDRRLKRVVITVAGKKGHLGLEGVALVQALLCWGFGPQHSAWQRVQVCILGTGLLLTPNELQAHIAPLRPLVAQHNSAASATGH